MDAKRSFVGIGDLAGAGAADGTDVLPDGDVDFDVAVGGGAAVEGGNAGGGGEEGVRDGPAGKTQDDVGAGEPAGV